MHNFQRKLLGKELRNARDLLKKQEANSVRLLEDIRSTVPECYFSSIIFNTRFIRHSTRKEVTVRHQRKIANLSDEQQRPLFNVHDTGQVHNLDIVPPRYVMNTLALGPRNSVLDKFNRHEMLAELDMLLECCKSDNVEKDTVN